MQEISFTNNTAKETRISHLYSYCQKLLPKLSFSPSIYRAPFYHDESKLYTYISQASARIPSFAISASGTSFEEEKAYVKAFIECIERYCLSVVNEKLIRSSAGSLQNAIDIKQFIKFSPEQIKQKKFAICRVTDKDELWWTKALDLLNNREIYVPAQTIYVPFSQDKKYIRFPISTGASAGMDPEQTVIRGIYEVFERDTFIVSYLASLPGKKIVIKNPTEEVKEILQEFEFYKLQPTIIELDSDIPVPTILTILVDLTKNDISPCVTFGLKCHPDYQTAIKGSLEESFHSRTWLRDEMCKKNLNYIKKLDRKIESITEILDRGLVWTQRKYLKRIMFWLNNSNFKVINLKKEYGENLSLNDLKKILKNLAWDCYLKPLATPEVKKAGFFVYKVVIPQAHPLYLDERYPYLSTDRIIRASKGKISKINSFLQPFL